MISGCGYGAHPCKYFKIVVGVDPVDLPEITLEQAMELSSAEVYSVCQDCGGIYMGIR